MKIVDVYLNGEMRPEQMQVLPLSGECENSGVLCIADGGVRFVSDATLQRAGEVFWFGDFDSSSDCEKQRLLKSGVPFLREEKKDDCESDFAQVLRFLENKFSGEALLVKVLAGLGARRDHEQINIDEATLFVKKHGQSIVVFEPACVISSLPFEVVGNGSFSLREGQGHYPVRVEIEGAQYGGKLQLMRPSHGLSNRFINSSVKVKFSSSVLIFWMGDAYDRIERS